MNLKEHLKCIHGWLPKEVNMPSLRQVTTEKIFPTQKAIVAFVVLLAGAAFVGLLLSALGNFLGISSMFGIFWDLITSMVVSIVFVLIYGRIQRKEAQKEAKLREL